MTQCIQRRRSRSSGVRLSTKVGVRFTVVGLTTLKVAKAPSWCVKRDAWVNCLILAYLAWSVKGRTSHPASAICHEARLEVNAHHTRSFHRLHMHIRRGLLARIGSWMLIGAAA